MIFIISLLTDSPEGVHWWSQCWKSIAFFDRTLCGWRATSTEWTLHLWFTVQ